MNTKRLTSGALALALMTGAASAETLMLGDPAISGDRIAFTYAGDIWTAKRDGSEPTRITSHPATEHSPHFSPDGSMIAFSGAHDGNDDVFVVPAEGGMPQRLTWHPGDDAVRGWSQDGKAVAFMSARETNHGRSGQLYHVGTEGGLPERQMKARYFQGEMHAEEGILAYIPYGPGYNGLFGGSSGWRGYRGGRTPSIILLDVAGGEAASIPGDRVTDIFPMFHGEDVVFLSDRGENKRFNAYRWSAVDRSITQLTDEPDWDVIGADIHGDTMIYEAGGKLKLLDLDSGETTPLTMSLKADLPQAMPGFRDASRTITSVALSPTGKRAVVTARGDVFTLPTEEGSTRNLTPGSGDRAYAATWSPDGQRIAYIHDDGETQTLIIRPQAYAGEAPQPPLREGIDFLRSLIDGEAAELGEIPLGSGFHNILAWTPDGKKLIIEDNQLRLRMIDLDSGEDRTLATMQRRDSYEVAVSPDGRWLAATVEQLNFLRDLVLFDLSAGGSRRLRVSDGMADTGSPAFSRDGKYLYFTASTNSGPSQVGLDLSSQEQPYRTGIYVAVLSDAERSPIAEESGDEPLAASEDEAGDKETDADITVDLDPDGLVERVVALPVRETNYSGLEVAANGDLLFIEGPQPGAANEPPGTPSASGNRLMRWSTEDMKTSEVLTGLTGFAISADGHHMLAVKPGGELVYAGTEPGAEPKSLDRSGLRTMVDPREEWRQIFNDVVRMEAEYFYDPDLHGLDWQAVADKYRPLLDHVGRREDLNTLMVWMIAEMQVGHNRLGGGDIHRPETPAVGLLGADLAIENGAHRIKRIYTGENWNPFVRGPLAEPGLDVAEGDYILAVNGQPLAAGDSIFRHLQGTVDTQVALGVADSPDGRGLRTVTVKPVRSEAAMRLWAWIESNRKTVEDASNGRVGYVYLPNTAGAGYTFFNRMFFPQAGKDALIIDERSNGGGQAANYITDVLGRTYLAGWKDREGAVFQTPGGAHYGPKIMMIDQDAGSGGDFLPYAFRTEKLGPLLGTRTWGGLIGISANPELIDGGYVSVPYFRFFDTDAKWSIENEGVAPDIEVPLDPVALNADRDNQLEAAVNEALRRLEGFEDPVPREAPAYPTELGQ